MATMKVMTAALAAVLVLTGCDSGTPSASTATASSTTPSATPTPVPTPTSAPKPTPTPAPKPKPTPPPKAKDGTNLAACRDADCQVQVSGRTTIKFSGGKLVITKIDKFAHFVISGQFGGGNGQLGPGAPITF